LVVVKIVLCGPTNLLHLSSTLTGQAGAYVSQATVTEQCAAENDTPDSADLPGALAPGAGFWFLVHGVNYAEDDSGFHGTDGTGESSQGGARDKGVAPQQRFQCRVVAEITDVALYDKNDVRLALKYAVDREQMMKTILRG
jgi:ABC-type transport system substrate-binding protein